MDLKDHTTDKEHDPYKIVPLREALEMVVPQGTCRKGDSDKLIRKCTQKKTRKESDQLETCLDNSVTSNDYISPQGGVDLLGHKTVIIHSRP